MNEPQTLPVGAVLQIGDLSPQNGGELAPILPRQYGTEVWAEGIFFRPANLIGYVTRTRPVLTRDASGRQTFVRKLERARPNTEAWEEVEILPTPKKRK